MLLQNLNIIGKHGLFDLLVRDERIASIGKTGDLLTPDKASVQIHFESAIAFPGLFNSHDHLDFNLFPQLGGKCYPNYREWGRELHREFAGEIQRVLQIPQSLRTQWGILKNLLNGFTTVVNHGDPLPVRDAPIRVLQHFHTLHSVGFEKNWKWKLNNPLLSPAPFVVHVGEGTDEDSHNEIGELLRWNLFRRRLVGVHGVAMDPGQARSFLALVWCPSSNIFLLNRTADIRQLKHQTRVLFGTDSTLTAGWNAWEHFREARRTGMAEDPELMEMLTVQPAITWGLESAGVLEENRVADVVVATLRGNDPGYDHFFSMNPEDILLVIHNGKIRLFDESMASRLASFPSFPIQAFGRFPVRGRFKYAEGNPEGLLKAIRFHCPDIELPWEAG